MRGGRHPRRHVSRFLPAAEQVAQRRSDVGGEEAVDQRIGSRVERGQTLDEGGHRAIGGVVRDEPEHLKRDLCINRDNTF